MSGLVRLASIQLACSVAFLACMLVIFAVVPFNWVTITVGLALGAVSWRMLATDWHNLRYAKQLVVELQKANEVLFQLVTDTTGVSVGTLRNSLGIDERPAP